MRIERPNEVGVLAPNQRHYRNLVCFLVSFGLGLGIFCQFCLFFPPASLLPKEIEHFPR